MKKKKAPIPLVTTPSLQQGNTPSAAICPQFLSNPPIASLKPTLSKSTQFSQTHLYFSLLARPLYLCAGLCFFFFFFFTGFVMVRTRKKPRREDVLLKQLNLWRRRFRRNGFRWVSSEWVFTGIRVLVRLRLLVHLRRQQQQEVVWCSNNIYFFFFFFFFFL
jgi:hypothetical protein